jgi:Protein of unknown function (DUF3443)
MRQCKRWIALAATCCTLWGAAGCGGGGSKSNLSSVGASGPNVATLTVNAGPNGTYVNGAFTSVTVCVPGSSNCQTISGVLVDTGSVGLRLLSSALNGLSLPQQNGSQGHPVVECLPFLTARAWGPVQGADIQIAGESASNVPIQVLSDTAFPLAAGCADLGLPSVDSLQALGANGLLGVGPFPQDCGGACATSSSPGLYYECPTSGCQPTTEALSAQVQNPVALFATDNNGVLIALPTASGPEASATGSLIFGIGTQSNNALGSATVYTMNSNADFTTQFKGQSYPASFIDSGSNGLFFPSTGTTGLSTCSDDADFYCPSSTQNLSATNVGANNASAPVSFSVANADNLFSTNDSVLGQLAGPIQGSFDWGLPFFYGRNVFTAIEGKSTPQGSGPYWAY